MSQYDNLKATIALNVYENHENEVTANMVKAAMNAMVDSIGAGYQYMGIAVLTPTPTNPGTPDQRVFYIAAQPGTYTNFSGLVVNDGEVAVLKYDTAWHKEVTGAATAAQVTELGQVTENPEWVRVVTDLENRILYGVKTDGLFYFGNDCPPQVKRYIAGLIGNKVDKVDGKSLINELYASAQGVNENPEFFQAIVDSEGKVVEAIRVGGTKCINVPVELPGGKVYGVENPEFLKAVLDETGRIISVRDRNGKLIEFVGVKAPDASFEKLSVSKSINLLPSVKENFRNELGVGENIWTGKKIAWYGTSIPQGGNYTLPIRGRAINAYLAYMGEMRSYKEGVMLPAEYPIIVGSLLGADSAYNHSQGSSRIVRNLTEPNIRYRGLALMNTAMNNLETLFGAYNIDTANKTFSRNLNNTVGITTWFDAEYETSWEKFARNAIGYISQSYEVRLVANHLIGSDDNDSYLHEIFGAYYNDIATMLSDIGMSMNDYAGHWSDVDLVVLEHSVNDNVRTSVAVDTDNIDEFAGAYNQIINTIRFYKPSMRIAIAANYINFGEPSGIEVNTYLGEIAKYHGVPFIDMSEYSQVSWAKQLTCGYWDANGYWHDSGFEWAEDVANDSYTTNATFPSDIRSNSLAQMKQYINPRQINGVWCWESASLYQWCADGIHPFSDKTGRLTMLIGRTLSNFLKRIGNN